VNSDLLTNLNEQQRQAVLHQDGPAMVLAGAGSGKTTVLTHRVAWLINEQGFSADSIMLVTFTNKAAAEMKQRVTRLAGQDLSFAGTFHSIGARLLRRHASSLGLSNTFSIFDTDDQLSLLKSIYKKHGFSIKDIHPQAAKAQISEAKNEMVSWEMYQEKARGRFQEQVARIYKLYQHSLNEMAALDFDDLLLKTLDLFKENQPLLTQYQEQLHHILVDEYQDTNKAQYLLTKMLAAPHQNLYVVGDFSQSIYAWRGADYRNMMALKTDFPEINEYRLEQNYRSTQTILDAATTIISHNTSHPILELWTDKKTVEPIIVYQARDWEDEARQVVNYIRQQGSSYRLADMAILYRTNAQSRAFEEAFVRAGIPYKVVGGFKFYERKEIKDLIAYLRYLINPKDSVSEQRLLKLGKRRWQVFLDWVTKMAEDKAVVIDWTTQSPHDLLTKIIEVTQFKNLFDEHDPEELSRWENVGELLNVASQFNNVLEFLENVALVQDDRLLDAENKDPGNVVTMMSLHSAKGLEFGVVFMVGMEDGLLPHSRSLLDKEEMEEERRLAYVGITRAKDKLFLTFANRRMTYGTTTPSLQSRFLRDIPEHLTKKEGSSYQDTPYWKSNSNGASSWQSRRPNNSTTTAPASTQRRVVPVDDEDLEAILNGEMDLDTFLSE
jgi:DNA helicase II / ATP-dependent DNA helicase PcrA